MVMVKSAVAAAVLAVFASGGVAHADPLDDQYLQLLASHGIQGDPGRLIAAGLQSCAALDLGRFGIGVSPYSFEMMRISGDLAGQGLSTPQMSQLFADANSVYCPGKA